MERTKLKSKRFFVKGSTRPPGSGRRPGSANVFTRLVKEAIVLAAEQVGSDGNGKGGLIGYLRAQARRYPEEYLKLLARLMPYQLVGPNDSAPVVKVELSLIEMQRRLEERGIPATYDPPLDPKTLRQDEPATATRH